MLTATQFARLRAEVARHQRPDADESVIVLTDTDAGHIRVARLLASIDAMMATLRDQLRTPSATTVEDAYAELAATIRQCAAHLGVPETARGMSAATGLTTRVLSGVAAPATAATLPEMRDALDAMMAPLERGPAGPTPPPVPSWPQLVTQYDNQLSTTYDHLGLAAGDAEFAEAAQTALEATMATLRAARTHLLTQPPIAPDDPARPD